ncbi:hypothetical protein ACIBCN_03310 [Nocardia sp. NPDC051052]|uniref:hypothetical protein n=1 Tax=Nocardia sp. NPDC051052 TaxID=3364322 RepID=UPI0037A1AF84
MGAYKAAKRGVAVEQQERRDRRWDSVVAHWAPFGKGASAARPAQHSPELAPK